MKKIIIYFMIQICALLAITTGKSKGFWNYPNTDWVCEDPDIQLHVTGEQSELTGTIEYQGKVYNFEVRTVDGFTKEFSKPWSVDATTHNDVSNKPFLITTGCRTSDEKIVLYGIETDEIFGGKYKQLEFHRVR